MKSPDVKSGVRTNFGVTLTVYQDLSHLLEMNSRATSLERMNSFCKHCSVDDPQPPLRVVLECVVKVESEHDRCSKHPFLTQQHSCVIVIHTAMYFLL